MKLPLQIAIRNVPHAEMIEELIRRKAEKLEHFCEHIMGCRVVVEVPHRHHEHGNIYQVRIDITVPGEEIVVNREPAENVSHRDYHVAVRDAFDAADRLLEDYVRRRRGDVKLHTPLPHARVRDYFPDKDYGFLETPDGREIYFQRGSVVQGSFDHLAVGTEVAFVEKPGDKGPQASTVKVLGHQ
jgi:cold shock CspA family protein/ribosome-associated translation inhibitor RaiA